MTSAFALYQSFVDAGFAVTPIMPRSKAPGEFVGHWKAMPGWNSLSTAPADAATLARWATWPGAGIGIVLGSRIGEDQIIAIDYDTNDPAELAALFAASPDSPMVKKGARGETRFFRASPDLKTQRFMIPAPTPDKPNAKRTLLEVLTGNSTRQTVCPPTLHPDGMQYRWEYGCGLTKAEDLPYFAADDFARLERALGALGYVAALDHITASPDAAQGASDDLGDDDGWILFPTIKSINRDLNNQALKHLGWVLQLGIYGTRPTAGGFEAVNTLRESNTGNPTERRKRNLKIHHNGIRDMGSDDTFTAIDLVMRFRNCTQDEAFRWLRERVPEPDDGVVIDFAVLSANIRKRMAREDAEKAAERGERHVTIDDAGDAIDVLTGEVLPPPPVNDNLADELPDHLTRPPGLLGDVTDYIVDTARTPNRVIALGAALTVLGTLAGRRDGGPTNSGTALYVLCLGPSGCGKQHGFDQIHRLMHAAGASNHIGSSEPMSSTAVWKLLMEKPLSISPIDEFGDFLKKINGKRAGSHEVGIAPILRRAFAAPFAPVQTPSWANITAVTVHCLAMSIYGASTPHQFYSALSAGDLENGTLNRFLILSTMQDGDTIEPPRDAFTVPDSIAADLEALYQRGRTFPSATTLQLASAEPVMPVAVPWSDDGAMALYENFKRDVKGLRSATPELSECYARTVEMALRLATIVAVGRTLDEPKVSKEDFIWGRDLALWSSKKLARDASDRVSENETGARWTKITERIKRAGGLISHELLSRYMKEKRRDLADALEGMKDAGLIEIGTTDRADGKPGARPRFYRLIKLERAAA